MSDTILITGGTGFLGRNWIPEILSRQNPPNRIYLLSRSQEHPSSIPKNPRVKIVQGDITDSRLIADATERKKIASEVTQIYHTAANTAFSEKEAQRTFDMNIFGTRNIIKFAESSPNLERYFHIGTMYTVNGKSEETIMEDDAPLWERALNPYEQSKILAELAVRGSNLPWQILRPSIFTGRSTDGFTGYDTRTCQGALLGILCSTIAHPDIYNFQGFWKNRKRNLQLPKEKWTDVDMRITGFPEITKNFIHIDDIVGQFEAIVNAKEDPNKTYHVITQGPTRLDNMVEAFELALGIRGLHLAGTYQANDNASKREKLAHKFYGKQFWDYITRQEPIWDTTNTDRCLEKTGTLRRDMSYENFQMVMKNYVERELPLILKKSGRDQLNKKILEELV